MIANLSVELLDVLNIGLPGLNVNREQILDGVKGDILQTINVDVLSLGNITDRSLNGVYLALATSPDPEQNAHIVAEAGPDEVTFVIDAEPVDVEDHGRIGDLLAHVEPMLPVVTHVVTNEGTHSHGVATNDADGTGSGCSGLRGHDGAYKCTVLPVEGLVNQGSGLSATATEDDGRHGNTLQAVKLGRNAGAVLGRGGEAGVG